jgi:hypothetical protein
MIQQELFTETISREKKHPEISKSGTFTVFRSLRMNSRNIKKKFSKYRHSKKISGTEPSMFLKPRRFLARIIYLKNDILKLLSRIEPKKP